MLRWNGGRSRATLQAVTQKARSPYLHPKSRRQPIQPIIVHDSTTRTVAAGLDLDGVMGRLVPEKSDAEPNSDQ